jgi:uncharacterized RDD family membrane protein YckC
MTCNYCGARNTDGEERCRRCGRRTVGFPTGELRVDGALATRLRMEPDLAAPDARSRSLEHAVQPRLFYERQAPNVIPFEAFAPPPPLPRPPARRPRTASPKTGTASRPPARRSPRRQPVPDLQEKLDFLPPAAPKPRTLGTTVEAVIYCEAPVATPLHRAMAAAADWSLVLIAYGLFLATYGLAGGAFLMNKIGLLLLGGALPLIALTYMLIFAVAKSETAGMHWTHLKVVTFEGERPDGKHWLLRLLGSCVSHCTVLGLLWIFADEESLTWQDHISGTFPTPRESNNQVFRRR